MSQGRGKPLLSDKQWKLIEPLLPVLPKSKKGGRPWASNRAVLEGILWVLRTGARWQDLPEQYPSPSTCWRRLQRWEEEGVWLEIWRTFLGTLDQRGQLDWSEAFADGSFAPAKKGAWCWQNQAGERHKVDGGGRRSRCSFGNLLGRRVPG